MLGLKKKNTLIFFGAAEFGYFGYKFKYLKKKKKITIFHIAFAEKSQKIRTVALWYKKLKKNKKKNNRVKAF